MTSKGTAKTLGVLGTIVTAVSMSLFSYLEARSAHSRVDQSRDQLVEVRDMHENVNDRATRRTAVSYRTIAKEIDRVWEAIDQCYVELDELKRDVAEKHKPRRRSRRGSPPSVPDLKPPAPKRKSNLPATLELQ